MLCLYSCQQVLKDTIQNTKIKKVRHLLVFSSLKVIQRLVQLSTNFNLPSWGILKITQPIFFHIFLNHIPIGNF